MGALLLRTVRPDLDSNCLLGPDDKLCRPVECNRTVPNTSDALQKACPWLRSILGQAMLWASFIDEETEAQEDASTRSQQVARSSQSQDGGEITEASSQPPLYLGTQA